MRKKTFLISTFLVLGSCTSLPRHEHLVGEVRVTGPNENLVCLEGIKTQTGQIISVYEKICHSVSTQNRWAKRSRVVCEDAAKGEAEVLANSDPHSVAIKPMLPFEMKTGLIVKVINR